MTKMIAVDGNNDIFIGRDGYLAINRDLDAVMQAVQHEVQAQLGEMVLAYDQGVPNFQTIWKDSTNVAQFEAYVRRAILSVAEVIEIQDFEVRVLKNVVIYSATIISIYGSRALNGTV